ncbi:MAG: Rne/Rng family ribonuclease [bacterium]
MTTIVRKILMNIAPCFTRIAVIEKGKLAELHIESKSRRRMLGNIYLGRVTNVLPGIQAAFVDIGLKRDAFLFLNDIINPSENIFTDPEDGFLQDSDLPPHYSGIEIGPASNWNQAKITDLVQPGQRVLVQLTREPMEMKGARVTTHISLPGRYLVLMSAPQHTGISKRIESEDERERLRNLLDQFRLENVGLIVRTAAAGITAEAFQGDVTYLNNLWQKILSDAKTHSVPYLIYQDLDIVSQVMRDSFDDSVEIVLIDSENEFIQCKNFVEGFSPTLIDRICLYNSTVPLFKRFELENKIQIALNRRVELPSGGYLIFDDTEAMMVIDVNTGRFAGKNSLEETLLKTNIEAAEVIAQQVRLRDIGGLIVIDFIDMENPSNRNEVLSSLRAAFAHDRSKVNISDFSPMGLVEITRKRIKRSLAKTFQQTCPMCSGSGKIAHPQAVAARVIDEALQTTPPKLATGLEILIHSSVKPFIDMCSAKVFEHFLNMGINIRVSEDKTCKHDHFQLIWL